MKNKIYCHMIRSTAAKNKLEDAVYEFLRSINKILIDPEEVSKLKAALDMEIQKINKQFSRCRPMVPKYNIDRLDGYTFIHCGDNFTYYLEEVRDFSGEVNQLIEQAKGVGK